MKFGNVVLLCKHWYESRDHDDLDTFWMDMAHAIDADGWMCFSKKDVSRWCIHRLDEMRNDEKLHKMSNQLTLSYIFDEIEATIRRASWCGKNDLSREDAIIWVFRSIIIGMEKQYFDEELFPNSNVLPFSLENAWIDDGKFSKTPQWHPAQMSCDYIERVKELFPNAKEQKIKNGRFNYVESCLHKTSYKDVRIQIGEDNLNDCIEVILSAENLQNHNFIIDNKEVWFEIGNFDNCYDLENPKDLSKTYKCRLLKTWDDLFKEYRYELKSVSEL